MQLGNSYKFNDTEFPIYEENGGLHTSKQFCNCTIEAVIAECKMLDRLLLLFMAALRNRCGHYIFALWFLSFFLFLV